MYTWVCMYVYMYVCVCMMYINKHKITYLRISGLTKVKQQ